jgi:phenylalanyl-tRNA synthetase alpha chain
MDAMSDTRHGHYHPLTVVMRDFERIFRRMGFSVALEREMEDEHHNFDALNVPPDHPARDLQDTFWVKGRERTVMRTQTSNAQIRYMEEHKDDLPGSPIRIIAPGRVFRSEATDARHETVFHQIEGLAVGEGISLSHLKGTLERGLGEFFGTKETVRLRPGYFPFVEPGIEVDAQCFKCRGTDAACAVCKGTGWIELAGSGMVHPAVLSNVGIDAKKYTGFAFGIGVERLAMVKYGIPDVRMFLSGDVRVINQF